VEQNRFLAVYLLFDTIHIQVTVTGMLKFSRFEQWPCTDRTVNVKQLLVSDANTESVDGELSVIYTYIN
jgi:hypothetical protein